MPNVEAHLFDITRVIQLAVAPVFLLTAIGTLINALAGRLARAVDRRRELEGLVLGFEGEARDEAFAELEVLAQRVRLVLWSMAFAVMSALLVCILIGAAFVGAFVELDLSRPVAALFVAAVAALTVCMLLFLREIFLAALNIHHVVRPQPTRVERK